MSRHDDASASLTDQIRLLVASSFTDAGLDEHASYLDRLCRVAVDQFAMDGAVIQLMTGTGDSALFATSGPLGTRFADIALTTGDGPARSAFETRRPAIAPDLREDPDRWPGFTAAAIERGIGSVYAFPLQEGSTFLGVMAMFGGHRLTLNQGRQQFALAFADHATSVILHARSWNGPGPWSGASSDPFKDHRAEIYQAQGMVMVDLGVDLAVALLRMKAHAFSSGIPLIEVARAIIGGETLPED